MGYSMNVELDRSLLLEPRQEWAEPQLRVGPSRRALRIRLHISLGILDVFCIFAGFLFAHLIYPVEPQAQFLIISLAIIPIYLGVAFRARAYSVEVIENAERGIRHSVQSFMIAAGAILFVAFYAKLSDSFSRGIFAIGIVTSILVLAGARAIFARHARSILGGNPYSVVLITDDSNLPAVQAFSAVFAASSFDPNGQCPFMYDRLGAALKDVDRVVVACTPDRRLVWVDALKGANVQAEILVPELAETRPLAVSHLDGMPTVIVTRGPLSMPDRAAKRAMDIVAAGSALIVLAPLFALVAIAIKLESRGPVFFIQTRIGRGNQMFRMFKFRSMRNETSDGQGNQSTRRDDDRITVVGRFIRRTSLDELPQLMNVLSGDMSIVGPRPHALGSRAEDLLFWEIDSRYWHRHAAKPGLTGLAQVRGYRGATNHRDDVVNRLHADLEYLDNWSLWKDLKIIMMTFRVVVHSNAF